VTTLILNEIRKLFARKKTWVVFGMFLLLVFVITFSQYKSYLRYLENSKPETQLNYAKENLKFNKENLKNIENQSMPEDERKIMLERIQFEITSQEEQIKVLEEAVKNGDKPRDWKKELKLRIDALEQQLNSTKNNTTDKWQMQSQENMKSEVTKLRYLYDNNINPEEENGFNSFNSLLNVIRSLGMLFLGLGIMIFVSDMVSGECTPPTLKFLLVQPITRGKVLASKFIAITISALILIIGAELITFLIVGFLYDFGNSSFPMMVGAKYAYDTSHILQDGTYLIKLIEGSTVFIPMGKYIFQVLLLQSLFIVTCCSFGFLISTIFKSSMISMATSVVIVIASLIIGNIPLFTSKSYLLLTTYGDPTEILSGNIATKLGNPIVTTTNSIFILIGWFAISYFISHFIFTKKDILI